MAGLRCGHVSIMLALVRARRRGIGYRLLTLPMAAVLRTRTLSEPRGFLKMLLAADSVVPRR
jgi:hypothetical protein